jgi:hypothetical protein
MRPGIGACGRVDGVARRGQARGGGSRVVRDRCMDFLRARVRVRCVVLASLAVRARVRGADAATWTIDTGPPSGCLRQNRRRPRWSCSRPSWAPGDSVSSRTRRGLHQPPAADAPPVAHAAAAFAAAFRTHSAALPFLSLPRSVNVRSLLTTHSWLFGIQSNECLWP